MSLDLLLQHLRQTAALEQVAGLISWDQETMMPSKGAAERVEQSGVLAEFLHGRHSDPKIMEWIGGLDTESLGEFDLGNVREAKRRYERATRIPAELARECARAASHGQITWTEATRAHDFSQFAPALKRNVELKRQVAAHLTASDGDLYDSLLEEFEPGAISRDLHPLLESLRPRLVALREKIDAKPAAAVLSGHFAPSAQLDLARTTATVLGYDFEAGRLDQSAHPFSSGTVHDARITTRVDAADFQYCLFSTIHEAGHAMYTQGQPDAFLPAGEYCSMGVHESQSRFWENQIGRSRPFCEWLFPHLKKAFPQIDIKGADALYAIVNRVENGYIRTEADEVHYNLHILLRYELERELILGNLEVDQIEEAWNSLFLRDFGREVPDPGMGVLQDVHWSAGLFGYFPTYSIGNIYAACIDQAMRRDLPDRDDLVRSGTNAAILEWLRDRIHGKGRLLRAPKLIEEATGQPPSNRPLLDYLDNKFGELYDL